MTSSSNLSEDVEQESRLRRVNIHYFSFKWKSDSSGGESASSNNNDSQTMDSSTTKDCKKTNNGFFRNIKKKLSVKHFYKSKRRITAAKSSQALDEDSEILNEQQTDDKNSSQVNERIEAAAAGTPASLDEQNQQIENNDKQLAEINENKSAPSDNNNSQNKTTGGLVNFSQELLNLQQFGWYWGGISRDAAEEKLTDEPDGAFLIRDSQDHRYLLTLSFKSAGKNLHSRIEHRDGKYSLCNNGNNGSHSSGISKESFSSIPDLIQHSMGFSEHGVFCYSRPRYPGHPAFPVRLTKPVSRLTQVKSLQFLCRFVIRRNIRLDNINKLPLPNKIKEFLEERYYL